jgi:molybdate transport system substrate-binding protein
MSTVNHCSVLQHRKVSVLHFVKTIAFVGISVLLSAVARPQGKEIRVAAAADLKFAITEMAAEFEKQTGTSVLVTYGSSGNFFSQIQNGAPFDLFFSADIDYPRKLELAGLAEPGTFYEYAVGRLVIWAPVDSSLDVSKLGWNALLDASVQKIAIANPEHAPYGRAAVAALKKAGIYESVKAKLVYGENISQAAQFVQSGNAQAGIIALSLAVSPAMRGGKQWEIPRDMHPAIVQGATVLKNAKNKEAAWAFLNYAKSEKGRATLVKYGFEFPVSTNSSVAKP